MIAIWSVSISLKDKFMIEFQSYISWNKWIKFNVLLFFINEFLRTVRWISYGWQRSLTTHLRSQVQILFITMLVMQLLNFWLLYCFYLIPRRTFWFSSNGQMSSLIIWMDFWTTYITCLMSIQVVCTLIEVVLSAEVIELNNAIKRNIENFNIFLLKCSQLKNLMHFL